MADIFDRLAIERTARPIAPTGGDIFDRLAVVGEAPITPQRPQVAPEPPFRPLPTPTPPKEDIFDRVVAKREPVRAPIGPKLFEPEAFIKELAEAPAPYKRIVPLAKGAVEIGVGVLSDTAQFAAMAPIGLEAMARVGFQGADETARIVRERQEDIQNLIGYEPTTGVGKKGMAAIHKLFGIFAEAGEFWGERTPGGPVAQTAVHTFFEGLPVLLGGKGALKKVRQGKPLTPKEAAEAEKVVSEIGKTIEGKVDLKGLEKDLLREPTKDIFDRVAEKTEPATLVERPPIVEAGARIQKEAGPLKPIEGVPATLSKDAGKAWKTFKKSEAEAKRLKKTTLKQRYDTLKTQVVDISGTVKGALKKEGKVGKKPVRELELMAGASHAAEMNFKLAKKDIYGGLTKAERRTIDAMVGSRRTVAIDRHRVATDQKQMKHPDGLTGKEHQALLNGLPPEIQAKLTPRVDRYFEVMREQLDQYLAEGLITKASYDKLVAAGDYSPRSFFKHIDPEATRSIVGDTTKGSGLKALGEGDFGLMETNSALLLSEVMGRTYGRVARNRADRALYEMVQTVPKNSVARMAKVVKTTKEGAPVYEKAPAGHATVNVMIEGINKEMILPKELAREWIRQEPLLNEGAATFINIASGTKLLKAMATGLNPEFAISNFFRDVARALVVTEEFSPHLPMGVAQIAKDIITVLPDIIKKKGRWKDAINEGIGMNTLTRQGRLDALGPVADVMGYFGETSEMAVRLAIRERAIKNGKSPREATHIARNQLDFAQGGNYVKAADKGIPYLNAAIQGTRGYFTAAKKNPKLFAYKMGQVGTLSMGLYFLNKMKYSEAYAQVPERHKVANFIIMTPHKYRDKDGNERQFYFAIPKDQGQRVVATIFEGVAAKQMGEEVDDVQIRQAIDDFLPIVPTGVMPPILDAMFGYMSNKDFFRNEDIWKGEELSDVSQEFTSFTPPAFVTAGEVTGMSPERLQHALSQFFTSGNVWTSIAGAGWDEIFENLPEEDREAITKELISKKPFVRKVLKSTRPDVQFGKELKALRLQDNTKKRILNRNFDDISQAFYDGHTDRKAVIDFIRSAPPEERKRLQSRHKFRRRVHKLPNRQFWMELRKLKPETKATAYWNRWRTSTPEQRKQLETQLRRVPGITSKRFFGKLKKLKKSKFEEE